MATPVAEIAPSGGAQQPPEEGRLSQSLKKFSKTVMIYVIFMKFFAPKQQPAEPSKFMSNIFEKGDRLDMWLYLSEKDKFEDFGNESALLWHEIDVPYASWEPESRRSQILKYYPSEDLKHNGSLYVHVFFALSGYPCDPDDPQYQRTFVFSKTHPIVAYLPKSKVDKNMNLLGNEGSKEDKSIPESKYDTHDDANDKSHERWISYWKPNITINLVEDFTRYSQGSVPPTIASELIVEPKNLRYSPIVYFNEFWLLKDQFIPLNETVLELPLYLELGSISKTKWQIFQQIELSFQLHNNYGLMIEGESDGLKRVYLEGNPYLLALTMVVSIFHSVFDFLAFKNDIQFWKKNKSMKGLSAKSVVVNFICQIVIFLYLLDNDTSWMILLSTAAGCCIEFWKIGKAMHIKIDRSGWFPMLRFRNHESYKRNKTKEYDDLAMKYLYYVISILILGFSVYSLMYKRHKSWYSWILSSLTTCVYMFGFIMMCPQLFINYKMKSVAHLPWRQMTYKFLNTIIDDLFAFVIKMPTLHRLSVFRDDLIFVIFIYQKWIYPVDKKRINEYGFGGEEVDESSIPRNTGIGFEEEDPSSIRASVTNKPQRGSKSKSKKKKKKKNK
ncbi:putative Cleft lip and palate transmembrane protein [Zostera marina]|uniref:Putative Cleft lip and palate transmembrane protein n=1 Tax=Zostera marina TaxID=29655 RepID=A0A0K9P6Z7_ZOSMR|nr:putative Cleft lip and palate transmembrane protein [Zostera marina]